MTMKKSKGFILWIIVLLALMLLGGALICTGLEDYLNGTQLPHHGEQLAQSIRAMLC